MMIGPLRMLVARTVKSHCSSTPKLIRTSFKKLGWISTFEIADTKIHITTLHYDPVRSIKSAYGVPEFNTTLCCFILLLADIGPRVLLNAIQ